MIQHLTECKTDKIVKHKMEWTSGRSTDFERTYKLGDRALHKNKTTALNYIESMKKEGINIVYIGIYKSIHRRSKK